MCGWRSGGWGVDGEARCCRRGWEDVYMDVDGEARCCRLVEVVFLFLLAAGWGLHV